MEEKRKFPRCETPHQRVWCESDDLTLYVPAANACEGGMFLRTANVVSPGERLRVTFRCDKERVVASAEVAWIRRTDDGGPRGMGVRFVGFEAGEEAFARFLQRTRRRRSSADASPS